MAVAGRENHALVDQASAVGAGDLHQQFPSPTRHRSRRQNGQPPAPGGFDESAPIAAIAITEVSRWRGLRRAGTRAGLDRTLAWTPVTKIADAGQARFWELAAPLLGQAGVTRSTMMGFPCLRLDGDFFATCDHRSGHLVVKLDELQVCALIDAGRAEPFAPNGRRFREWAAIPYARRRTWARQLDAAFAAAAGRLGHP